MSFWKEPIADTCISYSATSGPDRTAVGPFPFWSGMINDKGRHCDDYDDTTNLCTSYNLPVEFLSKFTVLPNKLYRFRLIGAQSAYAFKFSIQDHLLIVVATDGNLIKPVKEVHYVIVNTGERYDVLVNTSNHEEKDYWILAETLENESEPENFYSPISAHKAEAVLHYESEQNIATSLLEPSETWNCINMTCHVVNCPFSNDSNLANIMNYTCTNPHQFENGLNEVIPSSIHTPTDTLFYNFDFDGELSLNGSSVDGINFRFPPDPPVTEYEKFRANSQKYLCPERGCPYRLNHLSSNSPAYCACTQQVDLSHLSINQSVELVITNMNLNIPERLFRGSAHPVHLHGHSFYVVKTGYPNYTINGNIDTFNDDVDCVAEDGGPCETFSTVYSNGIPIQKVGWRNTYRIRLL